MLCPFLIYHLCPEQEISMAMLYKQTARGTVPLLGGKGQFPYKETLSSAGRHLWRCLPSVSLWLLNKCFPIHSQMFVSMSPSAKALHHFPMHGNCQAQTVIVSRGNAQRWLLPITYSGSEHGRESCYQKSHLVNGQKQHFQNRSWSPGSTA